MMILAALNNCYLELFTLLMFQKWQCHAKDLTKDGYSQNAWLFKPCVRSISFMLENLDHKLEKGDTKSWKVPPQWSKNIIYVANHLLECIIGGGLAGEVCNISGAMYVAAVIAKNFSDVYNSWMIVIKNLA